MAYPPQPQHTQNQNEYWHHRAQQVIPGGVSSPVRAFHAVGGTPRYFVRGSGSHLWDIDGTEYIDLVCSWGPMIAGHAHPYVTERVQQAVARSCSFGAPSSGEVLLAEEIIARVPACERVRFLSTGTEAVMTAIRLARAATQRTLVVKFEGCYHGHSDAMLVAAGSGVATFALANSPGVTTGQVADTVMLPYNDAAALSAFFAERGSEIAAVITEAAPANMGVVPPEPGFNALIASLTQNHGALFILDEVMTGFRVGPGGWWGEYGYAEGWQPDLITFGKVIGGGLPLAAVGGRSGIMDLLAPTGAVYQAGTLSGNPVATAAGLATLELCDEDLYRTLNQRAQHMRVLLSEALVTAEIPHCIQAAGNLFSVFFLSDQVRNFADAQRQNTKAFATLFQSLLRQGISIPPSPFEAWFVSAALSDADMDAIHRGLTVAATEMKRSMLSVH